MIVLFTDFGVSGPYVGQMRAVLHRMAPGVPQVVLFSDAPAFDPRASAYLLAAYAPEFPAGTVLLCVVDPGVGGPRAPLVLRADGRWFVGPDNGLFALVARRADSAEAWNITWRPERLSASFHGRDLFAPVAARLALGKTGAGKTGAGEAPPGEPCPVPREDWPDDLAQAIYIDGFGNVMTGLRAAGLGEDAVLVAGGRRLRRARSFSDLAPGEALWYENANGLAEIAVNRGRADRALELAVGSAVQIEEG